MSDAACRYYSLCVGDSKCQSKISAIRQYEHVAVFPGCEKPAMGDEGFSPDRQLQPVTTLTMSKVNALEHFLVGVNLTAESQVFSKPHRDV